jgi:16S rRNA (cytidine1402-2'-O)-methyltransferase
VVPGPSAAVAALVVSGLATDRFCFEGFLPRKGGERAARLAALAAEPRTVVLFEAPHRVRRTVADLARACGDGRTVAIVRELTKVHEEVWRGRLADAVGYLAGRDPRGEYVVVLGGAPAAASAAPGPDEIEARLAARMGGKPVGRRRSDAPGATERFGLRPSKSFPFRR